MKSSHLPSVSIIGREKEKEICRDLLERESLVTLTGPGGIGKTTLALAVAHTWTHVPLSFVALSSLQDATHVPLAIAQALELPSSHPHIILKLISEELANQPWLLILDNFEHVMSAASFLSSLLHACPQLKILVTSREVLQLREEVFLEVPPLPVPPLEEENASQVNLVTFPHIPAVALFYERAQKVLPHFQLTDECFPLIADICRQLDGIPLAIELAAARLKLFTLQELNTRLRQSLHVLSGGSRDRPLRHQTMRQTIAWSYELLAPCEQSLFRRLAPFDTCTIEAIETSMEQAFGQEDILDVITSLLNKHLVFRTQESGITRLGMYQAIREFALECVAAQGEEERVHEAHAVYFFHLVQEGEAKDQEVWIRIFDQEQNNIRAALLWFLHHARTMMAVTMVRIIARYWEMRGRNQEGFELIHRTLALSERSEEVIPVSDLAATYVQASKFAAILDRLDHAHTLSMEAVSLLQSKKESRDMALALLQVGQVAALRHEMALAEEYLERGLALFRALPLSSRREKAEFAQALYILADALADRGEPFERPYLLFMESIRLCRELHDLAGLARAKSHLATLYYYHHRIDEAIEIGETCLQMVKDMRYSMPQAYISTWLVAYLLASEKIPDTDRLQALLTNSQTTFEQLGNTHGLVWVLINQAQLAHLLAERVLALQRYRMGLEMAQDMGDFFFVCLCLEGLAELTLSSSPHEAVRLLSEAMAVREATHMVPPPLLQCRQKRLFALVSHSLPQFETSTAWREGQREARLRITRLTHPKGVSPSSLVATQTITAREKEVLSYVARGLTNKEIARCLQVSPRTVNAHIQSIYGKLGVNSRSAATRIALEHRFVE